MIEEIARGESSPKQPYRCGNRELWQQAEHKANADWKYKLCRAHHEGASRGPPLIRTREPPSFHLTPMALHSIPMLLNKCHFSHHAT
jgi:hypothetical protein